jgi:hypothetical protein
MPEFLANALDARRAEAAARARAERAPAVAAEATVASLLARKQRAESRSDGDGDALPRSAPLFVPPPAKVVHSPQNEPSAPPRITEPSAPIAPAEPQGTGSANLDRLLAKKRQRR